MLGEIHLTKVSPDEAELLWNLQRSAFSELLSKYEDTETNPACETLGRVREKLTQPYSWFYWIKRGEEVIGGIRIAARKGESKRISPLFVLPQCRNQGAAQQAIRLAEEMYGEKGWKLSTILQEKGNCHLYEKMGYRQSGKMRQVNRKMTLIYYEK